MQIMNPNVGVRALRDLAIRMRLDDNFRLEPQTLPLLWPATSQPESHTVSFGIRLLNRTAFAT